MENEIANRVKVVTKISTKILEENTGIQTQLEGSKVEDFMGVVLEEREKMMKRTESVSDSEA